jgi:hypothetical protein
VLARGGPRERAFFIGGGEQADGGDRRHLQRSLREATGTCSRLSSVITIPDLLNYE